MPRVAFLQKGLVYVSPADSYQEILDLRFITTQHFAQRGATTFF